MRRNCHIIRHNAALFIRKRKTPPIRISVRLPRAIHSTSYTMKSGQRLGMLVNVQDHAEAD